MDYKKVILEKEEKKQTQVKEMPAKWLSVIDLIVLGGLDFQPAMREAGYSDSYADANGHKIKQDNRFCEALKAKRANIASKTENKREEHLKFLEEVKNDSEVAMRDRLAAVKEYAAICGWHTETIKHETTERQALLDYNNRAEAARLALLALDTRQLPDVTSQGRKVVTSQCRDIPMTDDTIILPIDLG